MRRAAASLAALLVTGALAAPVAAQVPPGDPADLPFLSSETPRGTGSYVALDATPPTTKTIDGDVSDWTGAASRYGGTSVYSHGELIYQDHLFDAHGPDDGRDAQRLSRTDPLEEAAPGTYRIDALAQADAAGELGIPTPAQYSYDASYGDAKPHQDRADLVETRIALDEDSLDLLARTATMQAAGDTALLVLLDIAPGGQRRDVPFGSNLTTGKAEVAAYIADRVVRVVELATGAEVSSGTAVADPTGWTNAIEASIPLAALGPLPGDLSIAIATGPANQERSGFAHITLDENDAVTHANIANVAFRTEPVRIWFDKEQALALHARTIDGFFTPLDVAGLKTGRSERYVPGRGYHDRIFYSDPSTGVPQERGQDGVWQHYGVYLPEAYAAGDALPLQWWLHWRGGSAHSGAAVVPRVFKQFGEDVDTIVIAPSGRGSSTWYVGRGHVDVEQVWRDALESFEIDRDRVYSTGHSMGGWGSYLLTLLYPDRFAAAAPVAGPVTQGAWTGVDFQGCDEVQYDGSSPCYIEANGSRPRDQHTRKILENSLHVPYAILHGTSDELVPYSGVLRQHERLLQLGYRHRMYTYPGYEHYSHPIMDQWSEAASYLHSFTRPSNPARVVYRRDMPFERATEEVQSGGATLDFDFDNAYWMSELEPVDEIGGVASFDGRSLAIAEPAHLTAPDTGAPAAPGQTGPYVITGLRWIDDPRGAGATSNGFTVQLRGARHVRLDADRMSLDDTKAITGTVDTQHALTLELAAAWPVAPEVTLDGAAVPASFEAGTVTVDIPAGVHTLVVTPGDEPVGEKETALVFTENSERSGQYSDAAHIEAVLTDSDGAPLAGETVTFTVGSRSATAQTDHAGLASADIPLADAPGDTSVTAAFGGREGVLRASSVADRFTIDKEDATAVAELSGKSSKRRVTGRLTDADSGAPIEGRVLELVIDGAVVETKRTQADGSATFEVPPRYSSGRHTFGIRFPGDPYFYPASDDA